MVKYDFDMDTSMTTSTGMIAHKIKENSTVLEFGCSSGRLTKYLQEQRDCRMYIVELDKPAYEMAIQYAQDGVCGDILDYEWVRQFATVKFDFIIFADVLEHLSEPEKVLKEAGKLLADNGEIIVSIPNITHNDILIKAINDRFDYTNIGLLDKTHIHFWGLENIKEMARRCELGLETVEATYADLFSTEQSNGFTIHEDNALIDILQRRKCGRVYQFIITMNKNKSTQTIEKLEKPFMMSHIYFDYGRGYNSQNVLEVRAELAENGMYKVHYESTVSDSLKAVRFDPVEHQGCIIKNLKIMQAGEEVAYTCSASAATEDGLLLFGDDPMICTDVLQPGKTLTIDGQITFDGYVQQLERCASATEETQRRKAELLKELEETKSKVDLLYAQVQEKEAGYAEQLKEREENFQEQLKEKETQIEQQAHSIELIKEERERLAGNFAEETRKNQQLQSQYDSKAEELDLLKKMLDTLAQEIARQKDCIEEFRSQKKEKEQTITQLSSDCAELRKRLENYWGLLDIKEKELILRDAEIQTKQQELDAKEQRIQYYQNRKAVVWSDKTIGAMKRKLNLKRKG